jgi:putative addiction module component (TIGR02574 family)
MNLADLPQVARLTKEEKLQLVEDLWDAIATMPDDLPVSEQEKRILDERLDKYQSSPEAGLSVEEFKKRLNARL